MYRILHVVSSLNVGSGIMNVIMNYYRVLKNTIIFDFLYFSEFELSFKNEIEAYGGKTYRIEKPTLNKYFISDGSVASILENYKVIHIHEVLLIPIIGINKSDYSSIIAHSHSTKHSHKLISRFRNQIIKYLSIQYIDYRLACSLAAGIHYFGKSFMERSSDWVVENAVDYKNFKYDETRGHMFRQSLNLNDEIVICQIGRFDKNKNQLFSLKLCKLLNSNQTVNYKMVFIGDGEFSKKEKKLIKKYKLEKKLIVLKKIRDMSSVYNGSDILIMPSIFEGIPLSVIEAQVSNLTCLVSDTIDRHVSISNYTQFLSLLDMKSWINAIQSFENGIRSSCELLPTFNVTLKSIDLYRYYSKAYNK